MRSDTSWADLGNRVSLVKLTFQLLMMAGYPWGRITRIRKVGKRKEQQQDEKQAKGYSNMYAKLNAPAWLCLGLQPISIACLHSLTLSVQHIEQGYEIQVSGQGWPLQWLSGRLGVASQPPWHYSPAELWCEHKNLFLNASLCGSNSLFLNASLCGSKHLFLNASLCGSKHLFLNASLCGSNSLFLNASLCGSNSLFLNASLCGSKSLFLNASLCGSNSLFLNASMYAYRHLFLNAAIYSYRHLFLNAQHVAPVVCFVTRETDPLFEVP
jgi:hypothetical protein